MVANEDENKAWKELNEDKDIRSWLKWGQPHYSDRDIKNTIYTAVAVSIFLGLVILGFNQIIN